MCGMGDSTTCCGVTSTTVCVVWVILLHAVVSSSTTVCVVWVILLHVVVSSSTTVCVARP